MTSARWLMIALAAAGTLAGWVALVPPAATAVARRDDGPIDVAPIDVAPATDVTSSASPGRR